MKKYLFIPGLIPDSLGCNYRGSDYECYCFLGCESELGWESPRLSLILKPFFAKGGYVSEDGIEFYFGQAGHFYTCAQWGRLDCLPTTASELDGFVDWFGFNHSIKIKRKHI